MTLERLWTIQPIAIWEELQQGEPLFCRDTRRKTEQPAAYQWLQMQMRGRLPRYSGRPLWWAYCEKPDLRRHRYSLPEGEQHVRIELDAASVRHLVFPCWAWHRVFCQDYLAYTTEEYQRWNSRLRAEVPDDDVWPLPEPWRTQLEDSWQRLFAPDLPQLSWDTSPPGIWSRQARYEAVFESFTIDAVTNATVFEGTSPELRRMDHKLAPHRTRQPAEQSDAS